MAKYHPPLTKPRRLPDVHPDLRGFDVRLNAFGEVDMTIPMDRLNDFLDREVDDPKLRQWGSDGGDDDKLGPGGSRAE